MFQFNSRLTTLIREGEVVDFAERRKNRLLKKPLAQHAREIREKKSDKEIAAQTQLETLQHELKETKRSPFIPGFQSIDDILYWLIVEKMSAYQSEYGIRRYFNEKERKQLMMIAHHAPRLIKRLSKTQQHIHSYISRWNEINQNLDSPFITAAIDIAAYMDTEVKGDIEILTAISKQFA